MSRTLSLAGRNRFYPEILLLSNYEEEWLLLTFIIGTCITMELRFDAMLYSTWVTKISDAGHNKLLCGPQAPSCVRSSGWRLSIFPPHCTYPYFCYKMLRFLRRLLEVTFVVEKENKNVKLVRRYFQMHGHYLNSVDFWLANLEGKFVK